MIVFAGSCKVASSAGASTESKETFAAESTRAVVCRFDGLLQPELVDKLSTRLLLINWQ